MSAATVLDTVEELRDAGAEAIQIGTVRVVASTSFVDGTGSSPAGIAIDGTLLHAPYVVLAIGDPQTLQAALNIPGGVLETLQGQGADGNVTSEEQVQITALHAVSAPRYARPAPTPPGRRAADHYCRRTPAMSSLDYPEDLHYTAEHEWVAPEVDWSGRRSCGSGSPTTRRTRWATSST